MIIPVILGGGVGSRLWPLSRSAYPKQYNAFFSEDSLFQAALRRSRSFSDQVLVVAGEEHRFLILEQAAALGVQPKILLEPARRDTAGAVALASHFLQAQGDPLLLVMPADHVIQDQAAFQAAVKKAAQYSERESLVTFGCHPEFPSAAYGYIQRGDEQSEGLYDVQRFIEKPDPKQAAELIASGGYDWNAGIFLFRASSFLRELKQFDPDIYEASLLAIEDRQSDGVFIRPGKAFLQCPSNSIDYAVMEKTDKAMVVPVNMGWSDVGSWRLLHDHLPKNKEGNTFSGDVIAQDVKDTYIRSTNRLVVGLGLENLVVVETRDAVLVADKSQSQAVKDCVKTLELAERSETKEHARVYRPWGYYETLEKGKRFQVKKIHVKPGASLSLQMHEHRSEHWIVLTGVGEVTRDNETFLLSADQSTYIPNKTKHRLTNASENDLEIIEVQVGDHISEDDIHRYEDVYGRVETV
ncbi:MAG: mannose-1-phosphate guanylyltransferase/mannose-6-phosphate isomerase [Coxiellaceae bacterium]|nr:mannose-1-phosphate guanylyltransferase/mannose-6-phosphate isomerase [Coxiellaceae bacterium]